MTGYETIGVLLFATVIGGIVGALVTAGLAALEQRQREQAERDAERREQARREPLRRGELDAHVDALIARSEEQRR